MRLLLLLFLYSFLLLHPLDIVFQIFSSVSFSLCHHPLDIFNTLKNGDECCIEVLHWLDKVSKLDLRISSDNFRDVFEVIVKVQ